MLQKTVPFSADLVPDLKVGDTVAVHWNQVIKILTSSEEQNLAFWSRDVLDHYSNR